MWTGHRWRIATAVVLTAVAACDDDDDNGGTEPDTEFEASLNGANEVPAVSTTATGSATLTIEESEIVYRVEVVGLENVFISHIHVGAPDESGPVRMNLCNTPDTEACSTETSGVLVEGSNSVTQGGITFDSLVSAIRAGNAYVNVHTTDGDDTPDDPQGPGDFPGGEIRGQITPQ